MRHGGKILEDAIKRQMVTKKDFAQYLGMQPQNVNRLLSKANLEMWFVEKGCEFLNLDPADFFDYRPGQQPGNTTIGSITQHGFFCNQDLNLEQGSMMLVTQLLAEKDARIKTLESNIRLLQRLAGVAPDASQGDDLSADA